MGDSFRHTGALEREESALLKSAVQEEMLRWIPKTDLSPQFFPLPKESNQAPFGDLEDHSFYLLQDPSYLCSGLLNIPSGDENLRTSRDTAYALTSVAYFVLLNFYFPMSTGRNTLNL